MNLEYTAVIRQEDDCWVGWIDDGGLGIRSDAEIAPEPQVSGSHVVHGRNNSSANCFHILDHVQEQLFCYRLIEAE